MRQTMIYQIFLQRIIWNFGMFFHLPLLFTWWHSAFQQIVHDIQEICVPLCPCCMPPLSCTLHNAYNWCINFFFIFPKYVFSYDMYLRCAYFKPNAMHHCSMHTQARSCVEQYHHFELKQYTFFGSLNIHSLILHPACHFGFNLFNGTLKRCVQSAN